MSRRRRETVLLTGGRMPAALELARLFHASGHRVVMAETMRCHLSRGSRSIARHYLLPSPREDFPAFAEGLSRAVEAEDARWVVPCCEEIFWVARARERLPRDVLFTDRFETLVALHDKWEFVRRARRHGLRVPETTLVESRGALEGALALYPASVVKPVFSRFAARTLLHRAGANPSLSIEPTASEPWVVQRFVEGPQLCTYGIAREGRLLAHCAYASDFTLGLGATVAFTPLHHSGAREWVETFVAKERFTGQLAFDFIEGPEGLTAIECNPRATSGVHLFRDDPRLVGAITGAPQELIEPDPRVHAISAVSMLLALGSVRTPAAARRWLTTFLRGDDIVFRGVDPLPGLSRFAQLFSFLWRARARGISAQLAATVDIDWSGESGTSSSRLGQRLTG